MLGVDPRRCRRRRGRRPERARRGLRRPAQPRLAIVTSSGDLERHRLTLGRRTRHRIACCWCVRLRVAGRRCAARMRRRTACRSCRSLATRRLDARGDPRRAGRARPAPGRVRGRPVARDPVRGGRRHRRILRHGRAGRSSRPHSRSSNCDARRTPRSAGALVDEAGLQLPASAGAAAEVRAARARSGCSSLQRSWS